LFDHVIVQIILIVCGVAACWPLTDLIVDMICAAFDKIWKSIKKRWNRMKYDAFEESWKRLSNWKEKKILPLKSIDGCAQRHSNKQVRFPGSTNEIVTISNRSDFRKDEIAASHYSGEEFFRITRSEYETTDVMRMEQGKPPKENSSYRGLEDLER